jgi:predicted methyltransferase
MRIQAFPFVAVAVSLALTLGACGRAPETKAPAATTQAAAPAVGTLEWAVAGSWRLDPERDRWRHPLEALRFWGLKPGATVVEVSPGRGWYTAILAPYLAKSGGRLYAASFDPATATPAQLETLQTFKTTFVDQPKTFGTVTLTVLSPTAREVAPANSADLVIVARNIHTLLGQGYAEKAFADFYRALKPGGILGVEQHRASSTGVPDPQASNGYVQEAVVKMVAQEAGFEFVGSSEMNANPRDDRNHPFGVWTLPPTLLSAPLGEPPDPRFDTAPYRAIGESDRMTLKFRKPDPNAAAAATAAAPVEENQKK